MGILNVTEDSFSDGGLYLDSEKAKNKAQSMVDEGASIIDIGGESTRPGAEPVSLEDELQRVIPIVEFVSSLNVPVSIDTNKADVMRAAVEAGASMINDVCALQNNGALAAAAELNVPVCLMHMQGSPQTMQQEPQYDDVVNEIILFFKQRIEACKSAGIDPEQIIIDPGFGFGKTLAHNFSILNRQKELQVLDTPILSGMSRKSMIGAIIDKPAEQRVSASVALAILAWQNGAQFIRVHDVAETKDALSMVTAFEKGIRE
ncbi:MAG: dihydropteroate synthase [Gammaproteobacteria bacterium]|nr:dihydropteroate synthase [Gammaproteobacteria bacterium]